MTLNDYFDKIVIISLARRADRWEHAVQQCEMYNISADRFYAIDYGRFGNHGCTASHRAVLEMISLNEWPRTLVLEDDFEGRFPDVQERFSSMIWQVPDDWFMLYLGGHYAEPGQRRISANVVQMGHMKTTSSYGVTLASAREMAPFIHGCGPIDELYKQFHVTKPCYIFDPRLFVQYNNYSDLQQRDCNNAPCMEDDRPIKV